MAHSKAQTTDTSNGWNIEEQIEELKGKYHLRKKDWESYYEQSKLEILNNDQVISSLRSCNKSQRILLAQDENADEHVIQTVFRDDRNDRLSLQGFTASEAIECMNQTVCEKAKFLNMMCYEKEKRELKLQELKQQLQQMLEMEKNSPENVESPSSATQLENAQDKARIKYDTARVITKKYQDILETLKEEGLTLPAKLDMMEQILKQQKMELVELRAMSKEAISLRDSAKAEFSVIEQAAYKSRKKRDAELNATRKEVDRRKNDAEKVDRKAARATLISDQIDPKALIETQQKLEKQNRVLLYEDTMEKIKMAAKVTDINEVVQRIRTQTNTQEKLQARVQELEAQRKGMKEDLEKLRNRYHDMKYSGEHNVSCGQARLEGMVDLTEQEQKTVERLEATLKRNGNTLINVRVGLATLTEKLDQVRLPPPHHSYTTGDVYDQLDLCTIKVKQLVKGSKKAEAKQPKPGDLQTPEFHDFLELQLSPDNVRVKLQASETALSEFDYDGQENVVLGRIDIKNMAEKLVESKQKPKSKKGKKK